MQAVTVLLLALALTSCAMGPIDLDPFGRPITPDISLAPRTFSTCDPQRVDRMVELIRGTKPLYPVGRELAGEKGTVKLTFTVTEQGKVVDAEAISQQSHWFESHALIALRGWQFKPAELDGKRIAVKCKLTLEFGRSPSK